MVATMFRIHKSWAKTEIRKKWVEGGGGGGKGLPLLSVHYTFKCLWLGG